MFFFHFRFVNMKLIRQGNPPTPHQQRQRTCDAARSALKRRRHRACFSSHCGTSRDEKCAPPIVRRSAVSPRKKHVSNNPVLPWFELLEKLITGTWRTSLPHLRPRFVCEPFSLRGDVERLLTPFLQMCLFRVVPDRTFIPGMLNQHPKFVMIPTSVRCLSFSMRSLLRIW